MLAPDVAKYNETRARTRRPLFAQRFWVPLLGGAALQRCDSCIARNPGLAAAVKNSPPGPGSETAYFCVGFAGVGAGTTGCVFTGCDLMPCSTDVGPARREA